MNYSELSGKEFVDLLAGSAPVPGGGGACAYAAAIGTALGNMVGSLTVGKKKYAAAEEDILALKKKADRLQQELLALVEADAEAFEPLSRAYKLPRETEEEKRYKEEVMEKCLVEACMVPLQIMEKCAEAITLTEEFAEKGSKLAVSDAGVSAALLSAALKGASLNVYINTGLMKDRTRAEELDEKAGNLLEQYGSRADNIFSEVREKVLKLS